MPMVWQAEDSLRETKVESDLKDLYLWDVYFIACDTLLQR